MIGTCSIMFLGLLIFLQEHQLGDLLARSSLEDLVQRVGDRICGDIILKEIHEEVGLYENLIIHAINRMIRVMMGDEIANALGVVTVVAELSEHFPCRCRSLLLLQFSVAVAIFRLGGMDTDVMDDGGTLEDHLRVIIEVLTVADELREAVYFQEMLDAHGIPFVKIDHRHRQAVDQCLQFHRLL